MKSIRIERKKFPDRLGSRASGAIMIRMRTRDMASFLADSIKSTIKLKQYGIEGLKNLAEKSGWKISTISDTNPRYIIFTLFLDSKS
ncbi:MAG TPA: hypothetical protein DDW27_04205 [Bacteroidales bacterium]|nr:hypothetical protein [Bacteroidales bacterium]